MRLVELSDGTFINPAQVISVVVLVPVGAKVATGVIMTGGRSYQDSRPAAELAEMIDASLEADLGLSSILWSGRE